MIATLSNWFSRPAAPVGPAVPSRAAETNAGAPYPTPDDVQRTYGGVAWAQLVELEPQLESLLWRARSAGAPCRNFADVDGVFAPVRNELAALIGFTGQHHGHPILGSSNAYAVAYWKLYDAVAGLLPGHADNAAEAPETNDERGERHEDQ